MNRLKYYQYLRIRPREEHPRWRKGFNRNKKCLACGNLFEDNTHNFQRKFCSRKCKDLFYIGSKISDKHKEKLKESIKKRKELGVYISPAKGKHFSEITKKKMSLSRIGTKLSQQTRKKMSLYHNGKKLSENTKHLLSIKAKQQFLEKGHPCKGIHLSQETKDWIGLYNKERILSEEHKNKIKLALKLRVNRGFIPVIVGWNKGKHLTEEHKHNISINNIGKKMSEEFRSKISNSLTGKYGSNSRNWKGGLSFEPYPISFNRIFKEEIIIRDNFTCMKCNLFEEDAKKLFKKRLHVHHIDYNKKNTMPENCCALCLRCNSEVNKNRTHWTTFFQSLLSERYGYKYSEDGKIIIDINKNGGTEK